MRGGVTQCSKTTFTTNLGQNITRGPRAGFQKPASGSPKSRPWRVAPVNLF